MTESTPEASDQLQAAAELDAQAIGALRRLDPGGTTGLLRRVLETYARSLAELLGQLDRGRERDDAAAMRYAVHTLKSSSASIGALNLSRWCADAELALREDRRDDVLGLIGQVRTEAARVARAIGQLLDDPSTP